MERHHGAGTIDGPCPSAHLHSDVPERDQRLHGAQQSYALTVSYCGTSYYGWQKTESGPSIQGELEKALERILGEQVRCEAASRTDRGVHAIGQVVQFQAVKQVSELQRALNGHLPRDIRVLDVKAVGPDFHPTLDAKSKIYHYYVHQGSVEDPFYSKISWHYRHPLDLEKMRVEATKLIGTHDFSRFTTEVRNHSICTLFEIELIPLPENRLKISLTGDRFLYKMARRICGTLVQIGAGKIPPDTVGVTAPPHGLFLYKINYL